MRLNRGTAAVALAGCVAAFQASAALAQQATVDATDVEGIVVTGVLGNDDNPVNPVRLPQSARVSSQTLTAEDVNRLQARDVYDLLNYGSGVFTVTSGRKSPANLNIRGDSNFAFIIDGAYVPPQLASRILQTIPATALEEVRIVRTSTALTVNPLVGIASPSGAANNGFIVVRTHRPIENGGAMQVFAGSFQTVGGSARAGFRFGQEGGAEGYLEVIGGGSRTSGPAGFNLDRHSSTAGLKVGVRVRAVELELGWLESWGGYGIVAGNSRLRPTTADDIWRIDPINSRILTANGVIRWNEHNSTLLTVAETRSESSFLSQDNSVSPLVVRANDNSFVNYSARHNLFLGSTRFQIGVDRVDWENPTGQYYYEGIARQERITGYFAQAEQDLFDDRLNLDIGGRIDQVRIVRGIDYFAPGRQPNANVRIVTNTNLPAAHFLSAGASLRLVPGWLINARYGYSDQGPRTGVVLADPTRPLEGETRNKFEIGFEGRLASWLRPSLNLFYIDTQNEVTPLSYAVVSGEQVGLYGNTNSRRTGMEAILAGAWGDNLRAGGYRVSVTHYFDVLDPSGLLARTQPRTVAEATAYQTWGRWQVSGAAKYVSRYESNAFVSCGGNNPNCLNGAVSPYLPIGDYVNIDLSVSRAVTLAGRSLRLTANVQNLLDDNYETSVGYPSIGRRFGVEVMTEF